MATLVVVAHCCVWIRNWKVGSLNNRLILLADMNTKSQELLAVKSSTEHRNDLQPPLDFTFMCLTTVAGRWNCIL